MHQLKNTFIHILGGILNDSFSSRAKKTDLKVKFANWLQHQAELSQHLLFNKKFLKNTFSFVLKGVHVNKCTAITSLHFCCPIINNAFIAALEIQSWVILCRHCRFYSLVYNFHHNSMCEGTGTCYCRVCLAIH